MKRTLLRLLPVVLLLLISTTQVSATPNTRKPATAGKKAVKKIATMTGYQYAVDQGSKIPFSYTRSYQKGGKNIFITTYNIYDNKKKVIRNIVATHDKTRKTVEVAIKDLTRNGFPTLNVERTNYNTPFMGRFGSIGKVGAIANAKARNTAPSQLQVKFASRKYDYVKVVYMAGAHEDTGSDLSVYALDERN